jgi:MraZ protein
MAETAAAATPNRAPRGIFTARVDEKGRLKLPADLREYILRLGEKTVFITSLDLSIARIYTNSTWEFNQKLLDECKDDPETAEDVAFTANDVGADSDLDEQGRVLIPQELRRLLSIENQPVWLECLPGVINIYSKTVYEERKKRAEEGRAEKVRRLREKGLK